MKATMTLREATSRKQLATECSGDKTRRLETAPLLSATDKVPVDTEVDTEITFGETSFSAAAGIDSFKVEFLPWISVLQRVLEVGANDDTCTPQQWIVKALGSERVDLTHAPLLNHLLPELELDGVYLFKLAFDRGLARGSTGSTINLRSSSGKGTGLITKCSDLTHAQKDQRLRELIAKLILYFASSRRTLIVLHLQTGKLLH
jgi:hypothetical protein